MWGSNFGVLIDKIQKSSSLLFSELSIRTRIGRNIQPCISSCFQSSFPSNQSCSDSCSVKDHRREVMILKVIRSSRKEFVPVTIQWTSETMSSQHRHRKPRTQVPWWSDLNVGWRTFWINHTAIMMSLHGGLGLWDCRLAIFVDKWSAWMIFGGFNVGRFGGAL